MRVAGGRLLNVIPDLISMDKNIEERAFCGAMECWCCMTCDRWIIHRYADKIEKMKREFELQMESLLNGPKSEEQTTDERIASAAAARADLRAFLAEGSSDGQKDNLPQDPKTQGLFVQQTRSSVPQNAAGADDS